MPKGACAKPISSCANCPAGTDKPELRRSWRNHRLWSIPQMLPATSLDFHPFALRSTLALGTFPPIWMHLRTRVLSLRVVLGDPMPGNGEAVARGEGIGCLIECCTLAA